MTDVQKELFALQDLGYRDFHSKLMPTVDPARIIGIRTPALRKFAKQFFESADAEAFLRSLPHEFYEENNLHGMLIESSGDFEWVVNRLNEFLPYVDNWATCDLIRPKVFAKHHEVLLPQIRRWMSDDHPYTVRFGIEMLMTHFLDEDFDPEFLNWVAQLRSDEYYVNMMIAWYFATALAKQYEPSTLVLKEHRLDIWTHNKTIQKAVESYRITAEQKAYLRSLKRK